MRLPVALSGIIGAALALHAHAGEPPSRLQVRIGDQVTTLDAGAPAVVTIDGKPVQIRIDELPTRRFDAAGLRFDYPRHFPWEFEAPATWTLDGNNAVLIIIGGDIDADSTPDSVLDGIDENLKTTAKSKRQPVTLNLRSGPVHGVAMTMVLAISHIRNEAYILDNGTIRRILLLQDALGDDAQPTAEFTDLRARLAATLEFSSP